MSRRLAITNADIRTNDPARPAARSIVIGNGRVESLDQPAPDDAHVLDLHGRVAGPGLIDSHMHMLSGGQALHQLDLSGACSRQQFEQAIQQRHAALPAGQWLIAHGWSSENWGGVDPDASWLAAAGDRPVVAHRMDLHAVLVNDAVMQRCELDNEPPGGRIVRHPDGRPTGLMVEAAAWTRINPLVPRPTSEQQRDALLAAQAHCHSLGVTTAGTMEYAASVLDVFEPLRDRLTMRCRVTLLDRDWPLDVSQGIALRARNDDHLAIIGFKAFLDGTLGSRTARLFRDYADDPGNRGMLVERALDGHLLDWAHCVREHGFSPSMHAIGDEAVRLALDVIEALALHCRDDQRVFGRIEHAQQIQLADAARFRDVVASMQPLHLADDGRYAEARLGVDRLGGSFACRSLLESGAILAFGSDWPIVSADPLAGIRAAVTRLTVDGRAFSAQQAISIDDAMHAYTVGAACALGLPEAGTLRRGALGDLVVYDRDPWTADWVNEPPRVLMTIAGGEVVYDGR